MPEQPQPDQAQPQAPDLLQLAAELVEIPSESHHEQAIADHFEQQLEASGAPLEVTRLANNVVARSDFGCDQRLIIAGHLDTVPAAANDPDHLKARIEGDRLYGLGACDMKGSLAAQLAVATSLGSTSGSAAIAPSMDVTFVFYECEEVSGQHNGLGKLFAQAPHLLAGDAALLGEPTSAMLEAGCQGSLRAKITFRGQRAHTARPWKGVNAIHRLGELLNTLAGYEHRRPVIGGCEFREAIQAVAVDGGVAGNVVPDEATLTLNLRYAPDRTPAQAEAFLAEVVGECDDFQVTDHAFAAAPELDHPLLRRLVDSNNLEVAAKLGWTDVARFAQHGTPAANFGAGDSSLAHTRDEFVERHEIQAVYDALMALLV